MPNINGIDVSVYQQNIDWLRVKNHGIFWVAIRATKGWSLVDKNFKHNRAAAATVKFKYRLFYHWLEPSSPSRAKHATLRRADAKRQAEAFLKVVGHLEPGEGVLLDVEQTGVTEDQALVWCQTVEAATKRPVAVYTGVYVAGGSIWRSTRIYDGTRPRVLAGYMREKEVRKHALPFTWDAWQWTDEARIPGISTDVDVEQVNHPYAFDKVCNVAAVFDPTEGVFSNYPTKDKYSIFFGARGDIVSYLQGVIMHRAGGNIQVTGIFDSQTLNRVKELQAFFKLKVDGIVGPKTWAAIDYLATILQELHKHSNK